MRGRDIGQPERGSDVRPVGPTILAEFHSNDLERELMQNFGYICLVYILIVQGKREQVTVHENGRQKLEQTSTGPIADPQSQTQGRLRN